MKRGQGNGHFWQTPIYQRGVGQGDMIDFASKSKSRSLSWQEEEEETRLRTNMDQAIPKTRVFSHHWPELCLVVKPVYMPVYTSIFF